jgi:5-methylcytosine-specific restriction enzyme A
MPRAPKQCGRRGCITLVVGRNYCDEHAIEQRASSSWGRGSTRQSRRERAIVLAREPRCYLNYQGCTGASEEADHEIPLWRGGPRGIDNQRGACAHCHGIKSRREAAEARGAGVSLDAEDSLSPRPGAGTLPGPL